jgi:hypothetical protein
MIVPLHFFGGGGGGGGAGGGGIGLGIGGQLSLNSSWSLMPSLTCGVSIHALPT